MTSIKAILAALSPADSEQLSYAFENGLTNQWVVYRPGRFIGVNIDPNLKSLKIEQSAGLYSEGLIVSSTNGQH